MGVTYPWLVADFFFSGSTVVLCERFGRREGCVLGRYGCGVFWLAWFGYPRSAKGILLLVEFTGAPNCPRPDPPLDFVVLPEYSVALIAGR